VLYFLAGMIVGFTELNKKLLLSFVTEEEIFCRYLEIDSIEFDKSYKNVLRQDENPGCTFFQRETDNRLIFNDWSKGWKADCFDVVMEAYKCSFPKALEQVAIDFNLIEGVRKAKVVTKETFKPKLPLTIRIKKRAMTANELAFWNIGGLVITEEILNAFKIYAITQFWELRGEEIENWVNRIKMAFAYKYPGQWMYQIYRPEEPKTRRRFINSPGIRFGDVEYLDYEQEYVLITKSKKDAFYLRLLGLNVCFVVSEGIDMPPDLQAAISTFDRKFTLFDNDWTGKVRSVKYKQMYGTVPLIYPEAWGKDTAEVLGRKKKQFMFDLIDDVKRYYYL
jgi:hypothetical protein